MTPTTYPYRRLLARLRRLVRSPRWRRYGLITGKALLFQCFSSLATFLLVVGVTGNVSISAGISVADFVGKIVLYVLFELGWLKLRIRL